jgi:hypothetical protein
MVLLNPSSKEQSTGAIVIDYIVFEVLAKDASASIFESPTMRSPWNASLSGIGSCGKCLPPSSFEEPATHQLKSYFPTSDESEVSAWILRVSDTIYQ